MDNLDLRILKELNNLKIEESPFKSIAEKLDLAEEELLSRIDNLIKEGIIRRISISIDHRKAGMKANAMCICQVPEDRVESVGKYISSFPEVTHCYTREGFKYNFFFMIHSNTKEQYLFLVKKISEKLNMEIKPLLSKKEFKKTSFTL